MSLIDDKALREILTAERPPDLREYMILMVHQELDRLEHSKKVLKRAKKDYIKIQNVVKKCQTTEDVEEGLKDYPELLKFYDTFIAKDFEKMKKERKEHLEKLEKQDMEMQAKEESKNED